MMLLPILISFLSAAIPVNQSKPDIRAALDIILRRRPYGQTSRESVYRVPGPAGACFGGF
jgi:hypothetical protein